MVKDPSALIHTLGPLGFISGLLQCLQAQDALPHAPGLITERQVWPLLPSQPLFSVSPWLQKVESDLTASLWQGPYWPLQSVQDSFCCHSLTPCSTHLMGFYYPSPHHTHPERTATWTTVKLTKPLGKSSCPAGFRFTLKDGSCACSSLLLILAFLGEMEG